MHTNSRICSLKLDSRRVYQATNPNLDFPLTKSFLYNANRKFISHFLAIAAIESSLSPSLSLSLEVQNLMRKINPNIFNFFIIKKKIIIFLFPLINFTKFLLRKKNGKELTNRKCNHFFIWIWINNNIFHNRSYWIISFFCNIRCLNIPSFA